MSAKCMILLVAAIATFNNCIFSTDGSEDGKRLVKDLMDSYSPLILPVAVPSDPVIVRIGLTLMAIVQLDTRMNSIETLSWISMDWKDSHLIWDPVQYGNISSLSIPPEKVWVPDLYFYNHDGENFNSIHQTHVVVQSDGNMTFIGPGNVKTTCTPDMTDYPIDRHNCSMKIGSWTHSGDSLNLEMGFEGGIDLTSFTENQLWEIKGSTGVKNTIYYICCPEPFVDITYTLAIQRRGEPTLAFAKLMDFLSVTLLVFSLILTPSTQLKIILVLVEMPICLWTACNLSPDTHVMNNPPRIVSYFLNLLVLSFIIFLWNLSIHFMYFAPRPMPFWLKKLTVDSNCIRYLGPLVPSRATSSNESSVGPHRNRLTSETQNDDIPVSDLIHLIAKMESIMEQKHQEGNNCNNDRALQDWKVLAIVLDRLLCLIWILAVVIFSCAAFPSFSTEL